MELVSDILNQFSKLNDEHNWIHIDNESQFIRQDFYKNKRIEAGNANLKKHKRDETSYSTTNLQDDLPKPKKKKRLKPLPPEFVSLLNGHENKYGINASYLSKTVRKINGRKIGRTLEERLQNKIPDSRSDPIPTTLPKSKYKPKFIGSIRKIPQQPENETKTKNSKARTKMKKAMTISNKEKALNNGTGVIPSLLENEDQKSMEMLNTDQIVKRMRSTSPNKVSTKSKKKSSPSRIPNVNKKPGANLSLKENGEQKSVEKLKEQTVNAIRSTSPNEVRKKTKKISSPRNIPNLNKKPEANLSFLENGEQESMEILKAEKTAKTLRSTSPNQVNKKAMNISSRSQKTTGLNKKLKANLSLEENEKQESMEMLRKEKTVRTMRSTSPHLNLKTSFFSSQNIGLNSEPMLSFSSQKIGKHVKPMSPSVVRETKKTELKAPPSENKIKLKIKSRSPQTYGMKPVSVTFPKAVEHKSRSVSPISKKKIEEKTAQNTQDFAIKPMSSTSSLQTIKYTSRSVSPISKSKIKEQTATIFPHRKARTPSPPSQTLTTSEVDSIKKNKKTKQILLANAVEPENTRRSFLTMFNKKKKNSLDESSSQTPNVKSNGSSKKPALKTNVTSTEAALKTNVSSKVSALKTSEFSKETAFKTNNSPYKPALKTEVSKSSLKSNDSKTKVTKASIRFEKKTLKKNLHYKKDLIKFLHISDIKKFTKEFFEQYLWNRHCSPLRRNCRPLGPLKPPPRAHGYKKNFLHTVIRPKSKVKVKEKYPVPLTDQLRVHGHRKQFITIVGRSFAKKKQLQEKNQIVPPPFPRVHGFTKPVLATFKCGRLKEKEENKTKNLKKIVSSNLRTQLASSLSKKTLEVGEDRKEKTKNLFHKNNQMKCAYYLEHKSTDENCVKRCCCQFIKSRPPTPRETFRRNPGYPHLHPAPGFKHSWGYKLKERQLERLEQERQRLCAEKRGIPYNGPPRQYQDFFDETPVEESCCCDFCKKIKQPPDPNSFECNTGDPHLYPTVGGFKHFYFDKVNIKERAEKLEALRKECAEKFPEIEIPEKKTSKPCNCRGAIRSAQKGKEQKTKEIVERMAAACNCLGECDCKAAIQSRLPYIDVDEQEVCCCSRKQDHVTEDFDCNAGNPHHNPTVAAFKHTFDFKMKKKERIAKRKSIYDDIVQHGTESEIAEARISLLKEIIKEGTKEEKEEARISLKEERRTTIETAERIDSIESIVEEEEYEDICDCPEIQEIVILIEDSECEDEQIMRNIEAQRASEFLNFSNVERSIQFQRISEALRLPENYRTAENWKMSNSEIPLTGTLEQQTTLDPTQILKSPEFIQTLEPPIQKKMHRSSRTEEISTSQPDSLSQTEKTLKVQNEIPLQPQESTLSQPDTTSHPPAITQLPHGTTSQSDWAIRSQPDTTSQPKETTSSQLATISEPQGKTTLQSDTTLKLQAKTKSQPEKTSQPHETTPSQLDRKFEAVKSGESVKSADIAKSSEAVEISESFKSSDFAQASEVQHPPKSKISLNEATNETYKEAEQPERLDVSQRTTRTTYFEEANLNYLQYEHSPIRNNIDTISNDEKGDNEQTVLHYEGDVGKKQSSTRKAQRRGTCRSRKTVNVRHNICKTIQPICPRRCKPTIPKCCCGQKPKGNVTESQEMHKRNCILVPEKIHKKSECIFVPEKTHKKSQCICISQEMQKPKCIFVPEKTSKKMECICVPNYIKKTPKCICFPKKTRKVRPCEKPKCICIEEKRKRKCGRLTEKVEEKTMTYYMPENRTIENWFQFSDIELEKSMYQELQEPKYYTPSPVLETEYSSVLQLKNDVFYPQSPLMETEYSNVNKPNNEVDYQSSQLLKTEYSNVYLPNNDVDYPPSTILETEYSNVYKPNNDIYYPPVSQQPIFNFEPPELSTIYQDFPEKDNYCPNNEIVYSVQLEQEQIPCECLPEDMQNVYSQKCTPEPNEDPQMSFHLICIDDEDRCCQKKKKTASKNVPCVCKKGVKNCECKNNDLSKVTQIIPCRCKEQIKKHSCKCKTQNFEQSNEANTCNCKTYDREETSQKVCKCKNNRKEADAYSETMREERINDTMNERRQTKEMQNLNRYSETMKSGDRQTNEMRNLNRYSETMKGDRQTNEMRNLSRYSETMKKEIRNSTRTETETEKRSSLKHGHEREESQIKEIQNSIENEVQTKHKATKKHRWEFWKCKNCRDGKRFVKSSKCDILRRKNPNEEEEPKCKCVKQNDNFPGNAEKSKITERPSSLSEKRLSSLTEKRNSSLSEKRFSQKTKSENIKSFEEKEKENEMRRSIAKEFQMNSCKCKNKNELRFLPRIPCKCKKSYSEKPSDRISCKCKQANTEKKCACKKEKPSKKEKRLKCILEEVPNPEEYMLVVESKDPGPCSCKKEPQCGCDQRYIDNPPILLLPIDKNNPPLPCICKAKKRQAQQLLQKDLRISNQ